MLRRARLVFPCGEFPFPFSCLVGEFPCSGYRGGPLIERPDEGGSQFVVPPSLDAQRHPLIVHLAGDRGATATVGRQCPAVLLERALDGIAHPTEVRVQVERPYARQISGGKSR